MATPVFGALSDRIGRRPVLLIGALGTAAWAFAFFAEQFDTDVRCSGMSLAAQVPTLIGGSIAPFVAIALLAASGSGTAIAVYVLAAAALTTVAVVVAKETHRRDLSQPITAR